MYASEGYVPFRAALNCALRNRLNEEAEAYLVKPGTER